MLFSQCIRILNKKSSMKCHACQLGIVAMLVVQSCYGWDFTSNLDGWTDSKACKKKHLDPISLGEGTQRSSSRTESMPEKMPAFGWGNMLVSRWVTTYVAFHGFFWGAGSARHHKEPFFYESEIYLSCEVWKAVVHFFWSSVHLEVLCQTFVEMSCQTKKTPSDQLVLHTR